MTAVRGNHEQMALDARASSQSTLWLMNGGDWFTRLTAEHAAQAEALLFFVSGCHGYWKFAAAIARM